MSAQFSSDNPNPAMLNSRELLKYARTLLDGQLAVPPCAAIAPTVAEATPLLRQHAKAARPSRAPLTASSKFIAAAGPTKGSVKLRQNAQGGTKAYVYGYAVVPADDAGSGQQYLFRAAAWNNLSSAPYSQTETRYLQ